MPVTLTMSEHRAETLWKLVDEAVVNAKYFALKTKTQQSKTRLADLQILQDELTKAIAKGDAS